MTGYTVNTGTSKAFANGWDRIFGSQGGAKAKTTPARKTKAAPAKTPKAKAGRKG
jgi:hypothetical protein